MRGSALTLPRPAIYAIKKPRGLRGEYQFAAGNAGWPVQFRFAVHAGWSRVPELWTLGDFTRMTKFVSFSSLFALCLTASGCFPYHYTTCPGLSGIVVSAETHAPLVGAGISFDGTNTTAVAFSAADGSFHVPPERTWGIWIIPQDVFAMPWSIRIYYVGYETNVTRFLFPASATGKRATVQLGVVPLKPVSQ